ncbi:hypothetical protein I6F11_04095 [Ensifer sp. NBAIM29]|nr:hypothetical protein [Ensifer sp. NBAIM29]
MTNRLTLAQRIVRTACELSEGTDPDKPHLVTINIKDLEAIIDEHLEWWLAHVYEAPASCEDVSNQNS